MTPPLLRSTFSALMTGKQAAQLEEKRSINQKSRKPVDDAEYGASQCLPTNQLSTALPTYGVVQDTIALPRSAPPLDVTCHARQKRLPHDATRAGTRVGKRRKVEQREHVPAPLLSGCAYEPAFDMDECPPLSVLQGKWRSSFENQHLLVDLVWLHVNDVNTKRILKREGTKWTWFGWILVKITKKTLYWEKDDEKVVWTRVGRAPKLLCTKFDLTRKTRVKSGSHDMDALGLLKRNFNVLDPVIKNPNSELYGLRFTQSRQGVFAACLLTRVPDKKMNIIVYIATRPQVQNVGLGKILLQEVQATSPPGSRECNRWAALISSEKQAAARVWWQNRNFVNDVSEEFHEHNPFKNCSVIEQDSLSKSRNRQEATDIPEKTQDVVSGDDDCLMKHILAERNRVSQLHDKFQKFKELVQAKNKARHETQLKMLDMLAVLQEKVALYHNHISCIL